MDWFDDRAGRGYIIPNESERFNGKLQFQRREFRNPADRFGKGDLVFFNVDEDSRGLRVLDIHHALDSSLSQVEAAESVTGTITRIGERGFGFIRVYDGRDAFFHVTSIVGTGSLPPIGNDVTCELTESEKGLQARNVVVTALDESRAVDSANSIPPTGVLRDGSFRGTVCRNPRYDKGFGFIELNNGSTAFFHVSQLSDPLHPPSAGAEVTFQIIEGEKGPEATGITRKLIAGIISEIVHYDRGYGFINLFDGRSAFFHVSSLRNCETRPASGTSVVCDVFESEKGLTARDVFIEEATPRPLAVDLLPQAILARDARQFDDAARLYEKGMSQSPSIQLVLSFAAMEKNRNRKSRAMQIYEKGISLFPRVAKLREDAGILAASLGRYRDALRFFAEALQICHTTNQGGEKGVLLGLARTYDRMDTLSDLQMAVDYYEKAKTVFKGDGRIPATDELAYQIARIRVQHHRGNLAFQFVKSAGFKIVRAEVHDQKTSGADFIVSIDKTELIESYGLSNYLLIRCMFKSEVMHSDLEDLDDRISSLGTSGIADDQVALLIVSSLAPNLQRTLYRRIEERRQGKPSVIPLLQTSIETSTEPLGVLRELLDQWLYRRDLFALNSPVVGRRFFGREKPLAELREAITTSVPLGVFGLRKVGKTSLLKETERRLSDSGDIVAYIDLLRVPSDVTDVRWLYWRIANQLREHAEELGWGAISWRLGGAFVDFLSIPQNFPVATAFDADMTALLKRIGDSTISPRPKVALLLDEVERLLPTRSGKVDFQGFFDFFGYFRGLCQESNDFVFVVTGANAAVAETAQFDGRDNPVFNFFREVYLQLLDINECKMMIKTLGRGMGIQFEDTACESVHSLTGGHPFFTRQLCSFLANRHNDRPLIISRKLVNDAVKDYLHFAGKDFREILDRLSRDYPEERDLCVSLATSEAGLPLQSIREGDTVRHLVGYQIAEVVNGELILTMDLMRHWLRREYFEHE